MVDRIRLAIDALAAALLGGAVAFALVEIVRLPWFAAGSAGGAVFLTAAAALARTPAAAPSVPCFVPLPLEFAEEPPGAAAEAGPPDAAQQLREALAQLRRSSL